MGESQRPATELVGSRPECGRKARRDRRSPGLLVDDAQVDPVLRRESGEQARQARSARRRADCPVIRSVKHRHPVYRNAEQRWASQAGRQCREIVLAHTGSGRRIATAFLQPKPSPAAPRHPGQSHGSPWRREPVRSTPAFRLNEMLSPAQCLAGADAPALEVSDFSRAAVC